MYSSTTIHQRLSNLSLNPNNSYHYDNSKYYEDDHGGGNGSGSSSTGSSSLYQDTTRLQLLQQQQQQRRRRLSSTGEGSGDSGSTTTSAAGSNYGDTTGYATSITAATAANSRLVTSSSSSEHIMLLRGGCDGGEPQYAKGGGGGLAMLGAAIEVADEDDQDVDGDGIVESGEMGEERHDGHQRDLDLESNGSEGANNGHHEDDELDLQLLEGERQQIESFYRGLKSQVFICNGLVNFYKKAVTDMDWQLSATGIPVIIFDGGESRARNKKRIQIILAERGTCFMLWQDVIDHLSSYKVEAATFHTMHLSTDHNHLVGFSFDDVSAADDQWRHIEQLTASPENISLSVKGSKKNKKKNNKKSTDRSSGSSKSSAKRLPPKSHISQPCCFVHVTSVDRNDRARYNSLREFVPSTAFVQPVSRQSCDD